MACEVEKGDGVEGVEKRLLQQTTETRSFRISRNLNLKSESIEYAKTRGSKILKKKKKKEGKPVKVIEVGVYIVVVPPSRLERMF